MHYTRQTMKATTIVIISYMWKLMHLSFNGKPMILFRNMMIKLTILLATL